MKTLETTQTLTGKTLPEEQHSILYVAKVQGKQGHDIKQKQLSHTDLLEMISGYTGRYKKEVARKKGNKKPGAGALSLSQDDSRCCWFPKKLFMKLLEDPKANGIRMYFAVHTAKTAFKPEYADCLTLVVCSTLDSKKDDTNRILIPGAIQDNPSSAEDGGGICPPPPITDAKGYDDYGLFLLKEADEAEAKKGTGVIIRPV